MRREQDSEDRDRFEVRDPEGLVIPHVVGFCSAEGWLDVLVPPPVPAEDVRAEDLDDVPVSRSVRRRLAIQAGAASSPIVVKTWRDYDVFDRLNSVVVASVRR